MRISFSKELINIQKRWGSNICKPKISAEDIMAISDQTVANNYCPLPAVLSKGQGVHVLDVKGKEYLDFLSGFAAVSLGHCHPKLTKALCSQAKELAHTSRVFYTKTLAEFGNYVTQLFAYDKVLPMNSGTEAVETAVKMGRKWGYKIKGVPSNQAKVLFAENHFWGSSIAAISSSTEYNSFLNYGPFVPCFENVPYSDIDALKEKIQEPDVCAFVIEPVQGDAGVILPSPCYLQEARELCTQHKVLLIADETQCGLGRCGNLVCCNIYNVRPDVLVLGRALAGGIMPVSAVLADCDIMDVIEPGTHSSTFGGNALGCKVAVEALKILQDENLPENAKKMGECFRSCLCNLPKDVVLELRGIGLLNAIEFQKGVDVWRVCVNMMKHGLLVRAPQKQIICFSPPLTVKESHIKKACRIIRDSLEDSRGNCDSECSNNQKNRKKFSVFSKKEQNIKKRRRKSDEQMSCVNYCSPCINSDKQ